MRRPISIGLQGLARYNSAMTPPNPRQISHWVFSAKLPGGPTAFAACAFDARQLSARVGFDWTQRMGEIQTDFSTRRIQRWLSIREAMSSIIAPLPGGPKIQAELGVLEPPGQDSSGRHALLISDTTSSSPHALIEARVLAALNLLRGCDPLRIELNSTPGQGRPNHALLRSLSAPYYASLDCADALALCVPDPSRIALRPNPRI